MGSCVSTTAKLHNCIFRPLSSKGLPKCASAMCSEMNFAASSRPQKRQKCKQIMAVSHVVIFAHELLLMYSFACPFVVLRATWEPKGLCFVIGPAGPRFAVQGRSVSWMGWDFHVDLNGLTGLHVMNLRFQGERIAYEMHATDFTAVYSGASSKKDVFYSDGAAQEAFAQKHGCVV
eukprot:3094243-Pleurochrysis_carterae.AAC.3